MSYFAEKHYPEVLLPEDLDAYLEKGWYRMGQTIFTTHFLCFDKGFFSAIWVRLDLDGYQFNKRQRKLLHRNARLFRVSWQPATITPEKENLYRRYRANFPGVLSPSLRENLLDGEEYNIFSTYEITIYDREKLIGLSYFDLGHQSSASLMGVYDPDYQKYSLGYYSMLLEMIFCQKHNRRYYYPGYVVPGYERFDYKLRIGPVDYYHLPTGQWLPFDQLQAADIPLHKMNAKLEVIQRCLLQFQLGSNLKYYPLFEANLFGFWNAPYLDYPVILTLSSPKPDQDSFLIIVFDVRSEAYVLLKCSPFDDLQFYFNHNYTNIFDTERYFMELVVVDAVLFSHPDPEAVAILLQTHYNRDKA